MLIGGFPDNAFPNRGFPDRGFPGYAPTVSDDFRSKPRNNARIMFYKGGRVLYGNDDEAVILAAIHLLDF